MTGLKLSRDPDEEILGAMLQSRLYGTFCFYQSINNPT
jgi:hypothetical protein